MTKFGMWFAVWMVSLSVLASSPNDEAVRAATQWLQKVDGNTLQPAYQQSGELMRNAVTYDKWSAAISNARSKLGMVQARDLHSITPHTSFPGLPEGDYMIVVFKTKFVHKPDSMETMSFQRESDGQYRVIGYFVQ